MILSRLALDIIKTLFIGVLKNFWSGISLPTKHDKIAAENQMQIIIKW